MSTETYKALEGSAVTHSVAHHLMAIAELRTDRGYARVTDVARLLGLTRGSVSLTLKTLKQKGLVHQDDNRFLQLSDQGRALVDAIHAKRTILTRFFATVLKLPEQQAAADACRTEHLLSHDAAVHMLSFMRTYSSANAAAVSFRRVWGRNSRHCTQAKSTASTCTVCGDICLAEVLAVEPEQAIVEPSTPNPKTKKGRSR